MKKYHQLLLLVLSVISILCFVFYKHEYDRLRRVLEVLDFFGTPVETNSKSSLPDGPPSVFFDEALQLNPDVWQKYSEDIQFYSAIRTVNEKGWSMNSLAILKKNNAASLKKFSCALISGDPVEDKFEGTLEWRLIWDDSSLSAYAVLCNVPEVPGRSHLLSLYELNSNYPALNLPLNSAQDLRKERTTALCTVSQDPVWHVSRSVDFVLYHASLGVESFFIYHRGISNEAIQAFKDLIGTHPNLTISLMPWNTPKLPTLSLDYSLISYACTARQVAKSGPVILMPWDHFLAIPKDGNIQNFLKRVAHKQEGNQETRLEIQPLCLNIPNGESSPIRQNIYFKNLKGESKSALLRWFELPNPNGKSTVSKTDAQIAKLITFEPCPLNGNEKADNDPAVRAFSEVAQKLVM